MTRYVILPYRLALPVVIGDKIRVDTYKEAKVLAVTYRHGNVFVSLLEPTADRTDRTAEARYFRPILENVQFDLPINSDYIGHVQHPKHGIVYVYEERL